MSHNTLIADSGSTKTDWALDSLRVQTQGLNPFHLTDEAIADVLSNELRPQLAGRSFEAIRFYGSGVTPQQQERMERLLKMAFPQATSIAAYSDMLGAARALCGHDEGLACILGTGSNSCLYNGEHIVANVSPLGYVLGDEGSGAVLGRLFLNALYKGRLPQTLVSDFEQATGLDMPQVIERVYRQPLANRFLASLAPFIHQHIDEPGIQHIVTQNFRAFINNNLKPYGRTDLPIAAVGSVAFYFRQQLEEAAKAEGFKLGMVLRSPLDGQLCSF